MRIVRVEQSGQISFGVIEGDMVAELDGPPVGALRFSGARVPLASCRLLAPVLPSKVIAVGLNFPSCADEAGMPLPDEPLLTLKPSTSVVGTGDAIRKPAAVNVLDHEGELAIVVSGLVRNADVEAAESAILGYAIANDVTARDLREREGQWTRAKGYDTFCPLGPWIDTTLDPSALSIDVRVNGVARQHDTTAAMVFDPPTLVSFISHVMTLLPGDVILCGTPAGVGPMEDGDTVEVGIEGLGILQNRVIAAL